MVGFLTTTWAESLREALYRRSMPGDLGHRQLRWRFDRFYLGNHLGRLKKLQRLVWRIFRSDLEIQGSLK